LFAGTRMKRHGLKSAIFRDTRHLDHHEFVIAPAGTEFARERDRYRAPNSALSVAFNDRCDAVVATAVVAHDHPETIEPSVIDFLNSKVIVHWAEVTLGL